MKREEAEDFPQEKEEAQGSFSGKEIGKAQKRADRKRYRAEKARLREIAAQERFEKACRELKGQGFVQKDCTLKARSALWLGLAAAAIVSAAALLLYALVAQKKWSLTGALWLDCACMAAVFVLSIPLHEGLHALGWGVLSGTFDGLRFGYNRELLTVYCACERKMRRVPYFLGTLLPFLLLGAAPCAAAAASGSVWLLIGGIYNIFCAGADLCVAAKAVFCGGTWVLDHPSRCGFYAFAREKRAKED